MTDSSSVAYAVGRRQKRLRYWETWLQGAGLDHELEQEFREKLETYRLLIAKLSNAAKDEERRTAESALQKIDREMTTTFDSRRLMTSSIGLPAVGVK